MENLKKSLNVTPEQLKETRVSNFCENAKASAEIIIAQTKQEIRKLKDQRTQLLDLGDDQTTSIASRIAKVDTGKLMADVFKLGFEISEKERVLASLESDYADLFTEESNA